MRYISNRSCQYQNRIPHTFLSTTEDPPFKIYKFLQKLKTPPYQHSCFCTMATLDISNIGDTMIQVVLSAVSLVQQKDPSRQWLRSFFYACFYDCLTLAATTNTYTDPC